MVSFVTGPGRAGLVVPTARFLILTESGVVSGVLRLPLNQTDTAASDRFRDVTQPTVPLREFVAGPENRLACVAALSIHQSDGSSGRFPAYNPIYVYGSVGSGKTHFVRGLALSWQRSHPKQRMVITTASDFARGLAEIIPTAVPTKIQDFKNALFLVLEDVHRLRGKRSAQLALAELLDQLLADGRPVLITGNTLPAADDDLIPALSGRLSAGLSVPLQLPAVDARTEILRQLAANRGLHWSVDALNVAALHLDGTVQQLQAALTTFLATRKHQHTTIDKEEPEFQQMFVGNAVKPVPSVREIVRLVTRHFQIRVAHITGPSRRQSVVRARMIAIYLIRQLHKKSFKQIGDYFGHRDHTTVIHAYRKIKRQFQDDPAMRSTINELRSLLTQHSL